MTPIVSPAAVAPAAEPVVTRGRLVSLDVFRGATIVFMILVNKPGLGRTQLAPLQHTSWHGLTPTDWVFPFFLFIMGAAMAFSFARRRREGAGLWRKVVVRSILILLVGWALWLYPQLFSERSWSEILANFRVFGVLPRIALTYLFAGLIVLAVPNVRRIAMISALLLLAYWALMVFVTYPGKGVDPWAMGNNVHQWLDHVVLGSHQRIPGREGSFGREPLGLMGTIPSIVNTLLGYLAGVWLRSERSDADKTIGLMTSGFVALAAASFWAGDLGYNIGGLEEQRLAWMPLNKRIWTSTYALYTTGLALLALGALYWAIDMRGARRTTRFFTVFGANAIFAYAGSTLMHQSLGLIRYESAGEVVSAKGWIVGLFESAFGGYPAGVLYPILLIVIWWAILAWMDRRRIYIKL